MRKTIIITAGGIGKRMGGQLPKQFLTIGEKPLLMHTILQFYRYDTSIQIILTLPEEWIGYWTELCGTNHFTVEHIVVKGGEERFHSIQNALKQAEGELIGVHDGVRPFVSEQTIRTCFDTAFVKGNAIPVLSLKDSLRKVSENSSAAVLRSEYRIIQTPQVFAAAVLREAYQQKFHEGITDDATLVEALNIPIYLVEGNEENIKITTRYDLQLADFLVSMHNQS